MHLTPVQAGTSTIPNNRSHTTIGMALKPGNLCRTELLVHMHPMLFAEPKLFRRKLKRKHCLRNLAVGLNEKLASDSKLTLKGPAPNFLTQSTLVLLNQVQ